jgi:hypothetical protein
VSDPPPCAVCGRTPADPFYDFDPGDGGPDLPACGEECFDALTAAWWALLAASWRARALRGPSVVLEV